MRQNEGSRGTYRCPTDASRWQTAHRGLLHRLRMIPRMEGKISMMSLGVRQCGRIEDYDDVPHDEAD